MARTLSFSTSSRTADADLPGSPPSSLKITRTRRPSTPLVVPTHPSLISSPVPPLRGGAGAGGATFVPAPGEEAGPSDLAGSFPFGAPLGLLEETWLGPPPALGAGLPAGAAPAAPGFGSAGEAEPAADPATGIPEDGVACSLAVRCSATCCPAEESPGVPLATVLVPPSLPPSPPRRPFWPASEPQAAPATLTSKTIAAARRSLPRT